MRTFFIFTFSLIFLNFIIPEAAQENGDLEVTVTNIETSEGKIRAVLFEGKDGFPDEKEKAFRKASVDAQKGKTTFIFENVPYGEYAISLMHDKNGNGKMDFNFIGIPQEGYGISNNKNPGLSMPKYEDAHFTHQSSPNRILIHLRN